MNVHLHLTQIAVRKRCDLDVDYHVAFELDVVENQVRIEVITVQGESYLPADESKAASQFQEKFLESRD